MSKSDFAKVCNVIALIGSEGVLPILLLFKDSIEIAGREARGEENAHVHIARDNHVGTFLASFAVYVIARHLYNMGKVQGSDRRRNWII